jgi:hypothetical protein
LAATTIAAILMAKLVPGATRRIQTCLGSFVTSRVAVLVLREISKTIVDTRVQQQTVSPVNLGIRSHRNVTMILRHSALMQVWALTIIAAIPTVIVSYGVTRQLQTGNGTIALLQLQRVKQQQHWQRTTTTKTTVATKTTKKQQERKRQKDTLG